MANSAEPPTSDANQANTADGPLYNTAVNRCIRAYNRAYKKASADGESTYKSECAGNKAFLHAMPPLAGRDNIRNFIACVAEAAMLKVLSPKEVTRLLYAAQVAVGAAGREPNPPKSPAAGTSPTPPIPPGGSDNQVSGS